jgi:hypothetical protein
MNSRDEDIADPFLYKVYWKLMMEDICKHIQLPPTARVKSLLHEMHKQALNYTTIAGKSNKAVSLFLFEVAAEYAINGIFVRTSRKQPFGIEKMAFTDIVIVEGEEKRVWDLL